MKRIALRAGRLAALAASAAVLLATGAADAAGLGGREPATVVLETTCYHPTDAELSAPARARLQDGTLVDLWCGSRVEVTAGHCGIRIAGRLTEVPCLTPPGEVAASRRPSGPTAG